jgi:hypothetical protein
MRIPFQKWMEESLAAALHEQRPYDKGNPQ